MTTPQELVEVSEAFLAIFNDFCDRYQRSEIALPTTPTTEENPKDIVFVFDTEVAGFNTQTDTAVFSVFDFTIEPRSQFAQRYQLTNLDRDFCNLPCHLQVTSDYKKAKTIALKLFQEKIIDEEIFDRIVCKIESHVNERIAEPILLMLNETHPNESIFNKIVLLQKLEKEIKQIFSNWSENIYEAALRTLQHQLETFRDQYVFVFESPCVFIYDEHENGILAQNHQFMIVPRSLCISRYGFTDNDADFNDLPKGLRITTDPKKAILYAHKLYEANLMTADEANNIFKAISDFAIKQEIQSHGAINTLIRKPTNS